MNIGIDGRILDWRYSGIARYVSAMLESPVFDGATIYFPQKTNLTLNARFKKRVVFNPFRRRELYEQIILPRILAGDKINLFIQPYNFGIPLLYSGKSLLLIFDIIPLIFKDYFYYARFKKWAIWNYKINTQIAINKATKIICDSSSARCDLLNYFPKLNHQKVDYIYYGFNQPVISEDFNFSKFKKEKSIKNEYILLNTGLEPRKNIHGFLQSFAAFKKQSKIGVQAVITGFNKYYFNQLSKLVSELNLNKFIIFTDSITEEEKNALIKNSCLVVNPSHFEGFGIPVIEAAHFAKPIIASDIPAFCEVGEDYPIWFESGNSADLTEKIKYFFDNRVQEEKKATKLSSQIVAKFPFNTMLKKWEKVVKNI